MRRKTLVASAAALLVLSGCSTLPKDSEPHSLRSFAPVTEDLDSKGPTDGMEPDLLLRDFFSALSDPAQDYELARRYMAPGTAQSWGNTDTILVLDRIDLTTREAPTADRQSFSIRGSVVGRITDGGSYQPENGRYEATTTLVKNPEGQWRIESLPEGVVIARAELRNEYQPHNLYFFNPQGRKLASDRRWIYSGSDAMDTVLLTLLMEGPSRDLAPGVSTPIPEAAEFAGKKDGVYNFTGFGGTSEANLLRFGAQVVWTLANADIPGPYSIQVDGAPLPGSHLEVTTDDFADFNPMAQTSSNAPLFALRDGRVFSVESGQVTPLPGPLGSRGGIESVDISRGGNAAAVIGGQGESRLFLGDTEGTLVPSIKATTLTRPTFESNPEALWTVADGKRVMRVVRSGATGEIADAEVDTGSLDTIDGDISVLRLSNSGVRAAMIIDGRVYLGTVGQPSAGTKSITNIVELAPQLGGTALSLDWQPGGSLLIGTSATESPVWRAEVDGSSVVPLPTGNLSAPVVSVAASANTLYVLDSRAMLQLPVSGAEASFWREVPGLQGVRSAPVVAK